MRGAVALLVVATTLATIALAGANAQIAQPGRPPADPLAVTPIPPSQAQAGDSDMIRTEIEQAGYTDVADLSRDSMGVWHARARKGGDVFGLTIDKGGRIKLLPP